MSDENIKSLTITGTAAEDATKSRRPSSRKRKPKYEEQAEEEVDPLAPPIINKSQVRVQPQIQTQTQQTQQTQQLHQTQTQPQTQAPLQTHVPWKAPAITQEGSGQTPSSGKIVLSPPKNPRIKLQPKNTPLPTKSSTPTSTTRKARRFRLTVSNLNHRFTRAKKVAEQSVRQPIQSIRDYLLQKGVIQAKSKAPEKMLRSMYSDFMILKDPAL
jgi:hypothetical protein